MMAPPSQELEPPANPERFTTPEQAALGRQIIHNGGEYIVVWRDNLDENGASIWMRRGGRAD
jgi:hypothetical protein